ncbi:MAG: hypothetical protein WC956_01050 [bacterium]
MKRRSIFLIALAVSIALMGAGCARMPTQKRSANVIKSYLHKYGKKFPETPYGKPGVKEVEVTGRQEIHKHLVAVESFVTLKDGAVQRVNATLEKGPLGWRFISWENATGM